MKSGFWVRNVFVSSQELCSWVLQVNLKRLTKNLWLNRAVLIVWVISAVLVLFFLGRIDTIMHIQLYDFGLQYSLEWAMSYWMYVRLIYISLSLPIILSLLTVISSFAGKTETVREKDLVKQQPKAEPIVIQGQPPKKGDLNTLKQNGTATKDERGMIISCPHCKRVFVTPMLMLNFEGARGVLVNVCPYCNRVLGRAENGNKNDSDVQVAHFDTKLVS